MVGVAKFTTQALENADSIQKQADVTGLSAEKVQELTYVAKTAGVDFDTLSALFRASVAAMRVDHRLIALARALARQGVAVGLVTDNMDVFNQLIVPRHGLDATLPVIVNSADHGCLKHEQGGRLFDVALARFGQPNNYARSLLIDDSARNRAVFEARGGNVFPYTEYGAFERWARAAFDLGPAPTPDPAFPGEARSGD